jgi:hypothetical protein
MPRSLAGPVADASRNTFDMGAELLFSESLLFVSFSVGVMRAFAP